MQKRTYLILIFILILALSVGSFVYLGEYFQVGVDFLETKMIKEPINFFKKPFDLGWDFLEGIQLVYRFDLKDSKAKNQREILEGLKSILEQRFEVYQKEVEIKTEKQNLVFRLSLKEDIKTIIEIINQIPSLEFREESETEGFFQPTELTGKYLENASLSLDQSDEKPLILFQFNEEGAKILEALTKRNEGKQLALYIDQIPVFPLRVEEAISGGNVQIKMDSDIELVRKLTQMIKTSSLSPSLNLISQKTITQEQIKDSLNTLKETGLFGFLAIFLIQISFYRLPGLISFLSLLIYGFLFLILFKAIPIIINFGSISGFILSIGIVLISSMLFFSKMRKELRKGRYYGIAVKKSFQRFSPLVRKINLAILCLMGILFFTGTEFIKSFTFTFSLGILINIFLIIFIIEKILIRFEDTKLEEINWLWM